MKCNLLERLIIILAIQMLEQKVPLELCPIRVVIHNYRSVIDRCNVK